jgi:hypothetical protein
MSGWGKQDSKWEDLVLDAGAGFGALTVSFAFLALTSFNFFGPWLIVAPVLLFWAGFLRGRVPGRAWVKAAAIDAGTWCMLVAWVKAAADMTLVAILITFVVTLAGIWVRRWQTRE